MKKIGHIFAPMGRGRVRIIISYYDHRIDCACGECHEGYAVGFEGKLNPLLNPIQLQKILHNVHKPYRSKKLKELKKYGEDLSEYAKRWGTEAGRLTLKKLIGKSKA